MENCGKMEVALEKLEEGLSAGDLRLLMKMKTPNMFISLSVIWVI
jgi:hypothetical protein